MQNSAFIVQLRGGSKEISNTLRNSLCGSDYGRAMQSTGCLISTTLKWMDSNDTLIEL